MLKLIYLNSYLEIHYSSVATPEIASCSDCLGLIIHAVLHSSTQMQSRSVANAATTALNIYQVCFVIIFLGTDFHNVILSFHKQNER